MTPPRTILVAIALDDLAANVLDYAVELATCLGARLHVVHAVPRPVLDPEVPDALVQASLAEIAAGARGRLEPVIATHRAANRLASVDVELGDPVGVILAATDKLGADLVVIASHGRHGVARLVLGSVAEEVARRAPCPVTLVRRPPRAPGAPA